MKPIKKILIANRGEIAVRIIRTCREMDIIPVAIFSETDERALHVRLAEEAYAIGGKTAAESYLLQDKILQVAIKCGADAIHPGYGFLSENAEFAERVAASGIIFIGPCGQAMRTMGDKTSARQAMQNAGIPIVPGTAEPLVSYRDALPVAQEIGYPILLKAAAGGGGKGMRVVTKADDMESSFRAAASEAVSAFGDGRVYIEKYLEDPRHIEFQIMADSHGNAIYLGERECSIQRRHQKVVEEAPSVVLTPAMREEMGKTAIQVAQACNYENAGTIEFLVDRHLDFYFLEMNTRLQVEHPVTEMVTGTDLVRMQIEVAEGRALKLSQSDVKCDGHAIECRIYAEDPDTNFMPSTGTIDYLFRPDGPGVREDTGVVQGDKISLYYDPMLSKLVVKAETRDLAIQRMKRALREYRIMGIQTTIPFCLWVLEHPNFINGNFTTHFVEKHFNKADDIDLQGLSEEEENSAAIAVALFHEALEKRHVPENSSTKAQRGHSTAWKLRGWKNR